MSTGSLGHREPTLFSLLDNWPFTLGDAFRLADRPAVSSCARRGFPLDVVEETARYVIEASLPGVSKDDIEVSLEDNSLTIQVKPDERGENHRNYLYRERWLGAASRTIALPFTSSEGEVEATLKDGVLTLVVNKTPEKQVKKIAIR